MILAVLIELTYEVMEYCIRLHTYIYFKKDGKRLMPSVGLIVYGIHHTISFMSIPMNMYYQDFYYYWMFVAT